MFIPGVDICKFVNYEESDDFYIYEMGTCKCKPSYSYEHYVVHRGIIHFVHRGKGKLTLGGKTYEVHERQAFLIPENERAFYIADEEDPWEYSWIHIGGPKFPYVCKQAGLDVEHPIFTASSADKFGKIEAIMKDMIDHFNQEYFCIGCVYQICYYMMNYAERRNEVIVDSSLLYVKNAIKYIQLKYCEPVGVENIARACGLNRSYLTRLFRDATGYSLQNYLLQYRMKMASQFLIETSDSVQDIARKVGYADAFTFSKAYKRVIGVSPNEYRHNEELREIQGTP